MLKTERLEIDHHTTKFVVGAIALSLAFPTNLFSKTDLGSISASYHQGGPSQAIFIGFLFAIAAFLLSDNGYTKRQMWLSKLAALTAAGVALFPCQCGVAAVTKLQAALHYGSAEIMFAILGIFTYVFYSRARGRGHACADARAGIYALCCIVIALSIVAIALDALLKITDGWVPNFSFGGEAAALVAFGTSWLLASRVVPVVTRKDELLLPWSPSPPSGAIAANRSSDPSPAP